MRKKKKSLAELLFEDDRLIKEEDEELLLLFEGFRRGQSTPQQKRIGTANHPISNNFCFRLF